MKLKISTILIIFSLFSGLFAQEVKKPVVAVVLSGGGALGYAHVGALKVLEEEGITPDLIIGTSMGSIVGGLYCVGYSATELEEIILNNDWKETMLDRYKRSELSFEQKNRQAGYYFSLGESDSSEVEEAGLSHGQHVVEFLDKLLIGYPYETDFDSLPISFRAVGTDLLTGEKVVYSQGDLKTAIRASMSVPGIFTPVEYQGRYVIDGSWVDNLPTTVARELGADIVIAISLYSLEDDISKLNTLVAVTAQADIIKTKDLAHGSFEAADLVIFPELTGFNQADFEMADPMIKLGYQAASEKREEIRQLVDQITQTGKTMSPAEEKRGDRRVSIAEITLNKGEDKEEERLFKEKFISNLGRYTLVSELQEYLYSLYDGGDYYHVWYQLEPRENGEYILFVDAPLKNDEVQRISASVDFSTQVYNHVLTNFSVKTSYQRQFGEKRNSSLFMDFQLSPYPSGTLGLDHNLFGKDLLIGAQLYAHQSPEYYYNDGSVESIYSLLSLGASAYMEQPLFEKMNLSLNFYGEFDSSDYRMGTKTAEEETWVDVGVEAKVSLDTLDRVITPRKGINAVFLLENSMDFQSDPQCYFRTAGELYISFGSEQKFIIIPQWEVQSLLLGELRLVDRPILGAAIDFDGYYYQELRSDNLGLLGLTFRQQVGQLPLGFGHEMYLQVRGNGATLWVNDALNEDKEFSHFLGASAGVVVNSTIGEVQFNICINQDSRVSATLGISTSTSLTDIF